MTPSNSPGRGRRAPRNLRITFAFTLVALGACSTSGRLEKTSVEHATNAAPPVVTTPQEGGTGTRAKGEVATLNPTPASPAGGLALGLGAGQGRLGGTSAASKMRGGVVLEHGPAGTWEADVGAEAYAPIVENQLLSVAEHPLSTFSTDVDTASFSNARRFLVDGQLPPRDSIRVEEWLNYFVYSYPTPGADAPVAIHTEVSTAPWAPERRLVRIGVQSRPITQASTPPRNLVFLIDVSGSMQPANKLPLLKKGLALLARQLRPKDSVAIVVYAGASGVVLPPTSGARQDRILDALEMLEAGGSTNGGDGIRLAYDLATQRFDDGAINRVILATDGDFNVGTTSQAELERLIEDKRKTGVFLTVLGFGTGNVKDSTMELLADKGNGHYAYIDSAAEARKVLVREAGATLVTVAKDVKLQVEFNPARVESHRLLGYENRLLADRDFDDDRKDAGDLGAGHGVTALYEIVPAKAARSGERSELLTVAVRYKEPASNVSSKLAHRVADTSVPFEAASADHRFAVGVAHFALVLRGAPALRGQTLDQSRAIVRAALGDDAPAERRELASLIDTARRLASQRDDALVTR